MAIIVCKEKCTGCGICTGQFPFGAIEIVDDVAVINAECTLCGASLEACEFAALTMEEEKSAARVVDLSA